MPNANYKTITFILLGMVFCLATMAHAEVEASFAARYNFEKEKGIKWEQATDKTKRKWLETYKNRLKAAQYLKDQQAVNQRNAQLASENARYMEKQAKATQQQHRENAKLLKRQQLEQKRQALRDTKTQMMNGIESKRN